MHAGSGSAYVTYNYHTNSGDVELAMPYPFSVLYCIEDPACLWASCSGYVRLHECYNFITLLYTLLSFFIGSSILIEEREIAYWHSNP